MGCCGSLLTQLNLRGLSIMPFDGLADTANFFVALLAGGET
jgi:hypothetical protein